jgi:hypothetical protein
MKLAGEAGSLLKIEEEIRDVIAAARKQWLRDTTKAMDRKGQPLLFTQAEMDRLAGKAQQGSLFERAKPSSSAHSSAVSMIGVASERLLMQPRITTR